MRCPHLVGGLRSCRRLLGDCLVGRQDWLGLQIYKTTLIGHISRSGVKLNSASTLMRSSYWHLPQAQTAVKEHWRNSPCIGWSSSRLSLFVGAFSVGSSPCELISAFGSEGESTTLPSECRSSLSPENRTVETDPCNHDFVACYASVQRQGSTPKR